MLFRSDNIANPRMFADSTIAVPELESIQQGAFVGVCDASCVSIVSELAPSASAINAPNPSPPSLIGSCVSLSSGRAAFHPRAIAFAACGAVSVPLNLSGAMRMERGKRRRVNARCPIPKLEGMPKTEFPK